MTQKTLSKTDVKLKRQKNQIKRYKNREHWLKTALSGAGIIILLLILLFGYATDWTRGLKKDKDSAAEPAAQLETSAGLSDQGTAVGTVGPRSSGSTSDQTKNNTTTDTRSTTSTTTATNNSTTAAELNNSILRDLYNDAAVGENVSGLLNEARNLGVNVNCDNNLILQTCLLSLNGAQVTVKNLLGSGLITSLTSNL